MVMVLAGLGALAEAVGAIAGVVPIRLSIGSVAVETTVMSTVAKAAVAVVTVAVAIAATVAPTVVVVAVVTAAAIALAAAAGRPAAATAVFFAAMTSLCSFSSVSRTFSVIRGCSRGFTLARGVRALSTIFCGRVGFLCVGSMMCALQLFKSD